MAMKDYAKKRRRKVGGRSYDKYNDSDMSFSKVVRANRSKRSNNTHNRSLLSNPMFLLVSMVGLVFFISAFYFEDFKSITDNLYKTVSNKFNGLDQLKDQQQDQITITKNIKKHKNINNIQREVLTEKKVPKFEFYHTLPKMVVSDKGSRGSGLNINNKENKSQLDKNQPDTLNLTSLDKLIDTAVQKDSESDNKSNNKPENQTLEQKPELPQLANQINQPSKQNSYYLQLASFKNIKDAQALKAKLTLAGFDVIIQTVLLPSGETWHRVKSNKLNNIELAMSLHSQLKVHQIESIILSDNV